MQRIGPIGKETYVRLVDAATWLSPDERAGFMARLSAIETTLEKGVVSHETAETTRGNYASHLPFAGLVVGFPSQEGMIPIETLMSRVAVLEPILKAALKAAAEMAFNGSNPKVQPVEARAASIRKMSGAEAAEYGRTFAFKLVLAVADHMAKNDNRRPEIIRLNPVNYAALIQAEKIELGNRTCLGIRYEPTESVGIDQIEFAKWPEKERGCPVGPEKEPA